LSGVTRNADFPLIYASQIDTEEHTTFIIDDWIPAESICLLYAPKDHLKSFVAVDWFMSIATGMDWKGFDVERGACIYIAGEGNRGLKRRFKAWCIRNGVELATQPIALSIMPMQVLDKENIQIWVGHLIQVLKDLGEPIRLVVIDTLATNFGPGDENSPTDMARFLAHLKIYIQAAFTCSVLVVHHTGKDVTKGSRGGSSIEGNADSVFTLKRDGNPDDHRVILHCKHTKDSERPPDVILKAAAVELGYNDRKGFPVTSLILNMELSEMEQSVLTMTKAGKGQRFIAEELKKGKTTIQKIQRRLRAKNLLTRDEK
jgi:RecA-family ATPase